MKDAKGHGSDSRGGAGKMPLPGHPYHEKSDAELSYINKDASEAAKAMQGHSPGAEGKYLDQVNDASTVLGYRARGGAQVVPKLGALNASGDMHPKSAPVSIHSAFQLVGSQYLPRRR